MLLFNPSRVARGLRSGELTETQKARLLLGGAIGTGLVGNLASRGFETGNDVVFLVLYLTGMAAGLWTCYRTNQQGDGKFFVERFVCLSVPLTLLMFGTYLLLYYVAFWILRSRPGYDAASYYVTVKPYFLALSLGLLYAYYALLKRYIGQISAPAV